MFIISCTIPSMEEIMAPNVLQNAITNKQKITTATIEIIPEINFSHKLWFASFKKLPYH